MASRALNKHHADELVEHKIRSREIFKGNLLHVFSDEAELPDGTTSTREYIRHPGAAAVLPVYDNGDVMLIRQFRYPLSQIFFEVPAGKIDPGEGPDTTVRRELTEETGLNAESYYYLGGFYPSIGYTDEIIHLYLAWNLSETGQQVDDDEFVLRERLPFSEAVDMVHRGEISDGKSMVTILRAEYWWRREGPFTVKGLSNR